MNTLKISFIGSIRRTPFPFWGWSFLASMDLHAFFMAYDALSSSDHIIPHCSIMTLIHLPVACIFVDVPLGHWLNKKRCTPLLVSHFFKCDESLQRFRVLDPLLDETPFPGLSRQLVNILTRRTFTTTPFIDDLLAHPIASAGDFDEQSFISSFLFSSSWVDYHPRDFRLQQVLYRLLPFSPVVAFFPASWSYSWNLPIAPESRSLWYRLVHGKIRYKLAVSLFDDSVSPICCLDFSEAAILDLLFRFQQSPLVDNLALQTLAAKVMRSIWRFHWLYFKENVPFQPDLVIQKVFYKNNR
ncbi:hypothetical protein BD408DRAFT_415271 [Parasitella parasitica]|nr:hypothetical protein BD408DRAFT_415271 [Parasitella parasitica]